MPSTDPQFDPEYETPDLPDDDAELYADDESDGQYEEVFWPAGALDLTDDAGGVYRIDDSADIVRNEVTSAYGYQPLQGRPLELRVVDVFKNDDGSLDLRCEDGYGRLWRYLVVQVESEQTS